MKKILTLLFVSLLVIPSCDKNTDAEKLIIRGTVMQTDAGMPEIKTPLSGIPVYLINLEAIRDTITSWYNASDLLDSTQTDATGEYVFTTVPAGNVLVMPRDTPELYRFSWTDSPDSIWLTEKSEKREYEINFTTPEPQMENASYEIYCQVAFGNDFPKATQGPFTSLLQVQPHIVVYRKTRTWDFIGWGSSWGVPYPKFGWGSWYWCSLRARTFNYHFSHTGGASFNFTIDASNSVYQYKDEFLLEVYYVTYEEDMVFHEWMKKENKEMAETGTIYLSENYSLRTFRMTFNKESVDFY